MQNALLRIEPLVASAMIGIIKEKPLYYYMLTRIPKIISRDLTSLVGLGFDQRSGQLSILLNEYRLINVSVEEMQIILEHMILHIFYAHQHIKRYNADHNFHLAADLIINDNILLLEDFNQNKSISPYKSIKKILTPGDLHGIQAFNHFLLKESSAEELAELIKGTIKGHSFECIDDYGFYIQNKTNQCFKRQIEQSLADEIHFKISDTIKDAANELIANNKSAGNLPSFARQAVYELIKASSINYKKIIQAFIRKSAKDISKKRSWSSIHRKYPHIIKGRKKNQIPKILVVFDTSGSVWNDTNINQIAADISAIHKITKDFWIVGGDVSETFRLHLKSSAFSPMLLDFIGSGGTDLQFGFDAAKELGVNGIIVFTDGQIPQFDNYNIDTMFAILPGGIAVPNFPNAFML